MKDNHPDNGPDHGSDSTGPNGTPPPTPGGRKPAGTASPPGGGGSMRNPVTPHAPITGPREFKFLAAGIDTLDLGLYVAWGASDYVFLQKWTESYREAANLGSGAKAWTTCPAGEVLVHAKGRQNYRYHLSTAGFHLWFAATAEPGEKSPPNVYVSPAASMLWREGVNGTVEGVVRFIGELGGTVRRVQVSRVDLAADFAIPEGLVVDFLRSHRVCKSKQLSAHENGAPLETAYFGKRTAPVQARIYNKLIQAMKKVERTWILSVWGGMYPAWRVEFQVRRAKLREFGIDTLDDLNAKAAGLWAYLTADWLSLRLDDNANTSRRTVHPWWLAVQNTAGEFGDVLHLMRENIDRPRADASWYIAHIAGCLAPYAARIGERELFSAVANLQDRIFEYWADRDWEARYDKLRLGLNDVLPELRDEEGGDDDAPF